MVGRKKIGGRNFASRRVGARLWSVSHASACWEDEVTDFAASLLQPPAMEDGVGAKDSGPTEHDAAAAAALRIDWASCYVPLHDHDVHFGNAKPGVLSVVDGVGAYAEYGVDTGAFCCGLMTRPRRSVNRNRSVWFLGSL